MEKIKYCPKCLKAHDINDKTCDCGFEFHVKEEAKVDATVQTSNTRVIVDNVPLWLWSFLGFITLSILGWVFFSKFKESYPERSKSAKRGAIAFYITFGVILFLFLLYKILEAKGKIA